ncbi:MAG: Unknown protein [uncultured Sulfurovum sp.]|uniref:Uncharacterized protein n=1 Tax=uncultured Sulfurovum sp. TaxID=269237 RepID=A0A6S6SLP0_9BACT|nr:MAG: Unknown protein [uncultured Sulfurovum sp.]
MSCDRLVHEVVEIDKNECCSKVSDLHENFHFTAILYEFHTQSINPLQMTLTFVQIIPPTSIYKTSLKPPIA